ncbi:MAG TPA: hypothetical protein VMF08_15395, partial [Candidatus Sulfotelmatobacter sp.]|nr:hypothetical protein [Candidatus Sulfotelmatobacter sp.]
RSCAFQFKREEVVSPSMRQLSFESPTTSKCGVAQTCHRTPRRQAGKVRSVVFMRDLEIVEYVKEPAFHFEDEDEDENDYPLARGSIWFPDPARISHCGTYHLRKRRFYWLFCSGTVVA